MRAAMPANYKWGRCVATRADVTRQFIAQHLSSKDKNVLFIGGAGFDPRATYIPKLLSHSLSDRYKALYIKEQRPKPEAVLVSQADKNYAILATLTKNHVVAEIDIFESDYAVRGGRAAVAILDQQNLDGV